MIAFQCKESLQRGMSSLMLLTFYMLQKRAPWTTYLLESTNRHLACRALVWHVRDMGNAWTWQHMCPRSFFFFEKWWTRQDMVGTWPVLPKKKKKSVAHYLSHQTPPTSFHTDLLRRQFSSHPDLFFFSFSSIFFSFVVAPFALILVLFVSFFSLFFFNYFFSLFHTITRVELFYLQSSTWTKDV